MPRVHVALGGNIDPARRLPEAARQLAARFPGCVFSSAWRNPAEGFAGEDFLNAAAAFDTDLPIAALRPVLHAIEEQCGRLRADAKWAPRAMDIDLLLYGDFVGTSEAGELPRPDLLRRAYMLGPLAEIAPALRHPVNGERLDALWAAFVAQHAPRYERLALEPDA